MCDGCAPTNGGDLSFPQFYLKPEPADGYTEPSPEKDVRATKRHVVGLRIVVEAEDARKATERVLSSYEGTGIEVRYVSAEVERTEEPW